jgi:hypothetical protein
MTERLVIENFGPIKKADIDLRELTVFVGPQATGKSLAAQAVYFLRRYETLLLSLSDTPVNATVSALEKWFGQDLSIYVNPETRLYWNPSEPDQKSASEICWRTNEVHLSQALEDRYNTQKPFKETEVYIPAGRALYSFLPPYSLLSRVLASQDWPGFILTFYETLGNTINWLRREQDRYSITPSGLFLEERINSIFKGKIRYDEETIALKMENGDILSPTNIAAGQMEIWPFWAIVEAGLKSKRFDSAQIYFEEPEAHLHPGAQRNIMEMVAYLVRDGTRFLLTTHSPYVLYAINNFLMVQKVIDSGKPLPENISKEIALRPEQVSAYRFGIDGQVYNIMDRDIGFIDESELDDVADTLGRDFSALQDILDSEDAE